MTIPWNVGYISYKRSIVTPDKTALIYEDKPVTYKDLNEGVNRCAHLLQEKGIKTGDRIGVVLLNCVEFLELYFAAAKLGIIFVPFNWRLTGPELEYQINDCGAKLLVFHDSFINSIEPVKKNLCINSSNYIYLRSNPLLPECPEWAENFSDLIKGKSILEPDPDEIVKISDPLAIVYTSGVTGNPKGAVLSHEQTYYKNFQVALYTGATEKDVLIAQMPLFHSGGLFIVATPALMGGLTLIMRQGFDPNAFAEDIERYKGTIVFALTTMWRLILESGKLDEVDVSSVKCVVGGGERTPPSLFDDLAKRGLYMQQGFGQTENSAMMMLPKKDIKRKMGSIGKPGFFTDIWIQDSEGNKLPPGKIGEMVATGPTIMTGYWNLPEKTAEVIQNGILHTGDLGYADDEGYFYIVDREKDMYRSGGENVYPAEVEKVLANHPSVANISIIGVPNEKWGETGLAIVQVAQDACITKEDIHSYLEGKVAKYKYPSHIKIIDELPLTATMKVKKNELKDKYGGVNFLDAN